MYQVNVFKDGEYIESHLLSCEESAEEMVNAGCSAGFDCELTFIDL